MRKILPTKKQFNKWSLPSKYSALSFYFYIISLMYLIPTSLFWSYEKLEEYSLNYLKIKEIKHTFNFNDETIKNEITNDEIKRKYNKFNIVYPQIDSFIINNYIHDINQEIKDNILDAYQENLFEYTGEYEIGVVTPHLLSLKWYQYTYYYSAINGNASVFAFNIVPNKKQSLEFFDIFDARLDALKNVKEMIKNKHMSENGCDFFDRFESTNFVPRFFIKNDGIEFIFSEYEVSPGVCGSMSVFLEHHRLENNYRQDGPLGIFIKNTRTWDASNHFINSVMSSYEKEVAKTNENSMKVP
ncbi:RsiV family protein [Aliarcobacter vitoriensis]|uniref:RsiV family protein n=2 Tax=Aliarcobacter TaxID=2321111 RepID=UPI003AAACEA8